MKDLEILKEKRLDIFLGEVLALLHDIGKLTRKFVRKVSVSPSSNDKGYKHAREFQNIPELKALAEKLEKQKHRLFNLERIPRKQRLGNPFDLILHHHSPDHSALLVKLLNRCDGIESGADKGTTRNHDLPKDATQPADETFIATAFGYEQGHRVDLNDLDNRIGRLSQVVVGSPDCFLDTLVERRSAIVAACDENFRYGLGETRRAANDVTLWHHSFSVATLFKAAIAMLVLQKQEHIEPLRWSVLRINFDVLGLYAKAIKIADLLGYHDVVQRAYKQVKKLIEEEYPLGNEVYRDTSGIYFIVPDVEDISDMVQSCIDADKIEREIAPIIAVTKGDGNSPVEQLRGILAKARREALETIAFPFRTGNESSCWQKEWETQSGGGVEVCPVCGLRPRAQSEEVCKACDERRLSRVERWKESPTSTIWIDEIADQNGRVALIVGKFGLDRWLSGELVQTMLVMAEENNPDQCVPKNPSPARLRRVWDTCLRFWEDTIEDRVLDKHDYSHGDNRRCARWEIVPTNPNGWVKNVPYDGIANGKPISLLWLEEKRHFITIANMQWIEPLDENDFSRCSIIVWDPTKPKMERRIGVKDCRKASGEFATYNPYLPLVASPDEFMAFVPAVDALDICQKIREKYCEEFGKVQNRLPIFLGIVFFPRKTPLMAVMDTARRMLRGVTFLEEEWLVECSRVTEDSLHQFLRLSKGQARMTMKIPLKMGDNKTDDKWYPYFFFVGEPEGRTFCFRHKGGWLVHARDLKEDDLVRVTPSRFSCLFLETSSQRFKFDPSRDVLLLDEIEHLSKMWNDICSSPGMTNTKLHAIYALFEAKRKEWHLGEPSLENPIQDQAYRQLVESTLAREKLKGVTENDVLTGRFHRCLDIYLRILKNRVGKQKETLTRSSDG